MRVAPSGFACTELPTGGVLLHDPALPVRSVDGRDGHRHVIVGWAFESDVNRSDVLTCLRDVGADAAADVTTSWAGRWVLFSGAQLLTDAAALLTCHYLRTAEGVVVSSSPALIHAIAGGTLTPPPHSFRRKPSHLNYHQPPSSRVSAARSLLPSQALDLRDGSLHHRMLLPSIPSSSPEEHLRRFGDLLTGAVRAVAQASETSWIALTGGYDSRLVLAAALRADVPVKTFTITYPQMSRADRLIPPELSRRVGVEHRLIAPGHRQAARAAAFDAHSLRNIRERDRSFYLHQQYDFAGPRDVILRSGCLEGAAGGYAILDLKSEAPGREAPEPAAVFRNLASRWHAPNAAAFEEWRAWVAADPADQLDWRERFFLEGRLAGYLASVEQSLDILPTLHMHPANVAEIYARGLALPLSWRVNKEHQHRLVGQWAAPLAEVAYNTPDPIWRKLWWRSVAALRPRG